MVSIVIAKWCGSCGQMKSFQDFYLSKNRKDGLHTWCKECHKAYGREYHLTRTYTEAQREARRAKDKERYYRIKGTPEYVDYKRDYQRRYIKTDRAKVVRKRVNKRWREANRELCLKRGRKYYRDNIEVRRQARRDYYYSNKGICLEGVRRRKSRKLAAEGSFTEREFVRIYNLYGCKCLACDDTVSYGEITRDHIVPLVHGGPDFIDNIQPLCLSCNLSKGTQSVDYRPFILTFNTK